MWHPTHMMQIAHDREAELARDAEACGLAQKAEQDRMQGGQQPNGRVGATASLAALFVLLLLAVLAGASVPGAWLLFLAR